MMIFHGAMLNNQRLYSLGFHHPFGRFLVASACLILTSCKKNAHMCACMSKDWLHPPVATDTCLGPKKVQTWWHMLVARLQIPLELVA